MRISPSIALLAAGASVASAEDFTTTTLTSTTTRTMTLTQCNPTFTDCPLRTSSSSPAVTSSTSSTPSSSSSSTPISTPTWPVSNSTVPIGPTAIVTTSSIALPSPSSPGDTTTTGVPTGAATRGQVLSNGLVAAVVAGVAIAVAF
ncbi:hypothetical protein K4F52_001859 [Lecanicillium sp. MT-2017a]|nr:hypothetical protein K4F52_001859 [Lecanicillium sp. MT-2017a]